MTNALLLHSKVSFICSVCFKVCFFLSLMNPWSGVAVLFYVCLNQLANLCPQIVVAADSGNSHTSMCEQLSQECVLLILFCALRDRLFWYWPAGVLMKTAQGFVIVNLAGDEKKKLKQRSY